LLRHRVRFYQARRRRRVGAALAAVVFCTGCTATGSDPDSEGLVLVRVIGPSKEIVRVRLSDGAEQRVTSTPERDETWPYWSPIAKRLVFQAAEGSSRSDLVLWSAEEGEELLAQTTQRDERWPAWSPTTAALVFAFRGRQPPAGLGVHNAESGRARLAARSGADDYFLRPSFSPDGTHLVAQRRIDERQSSLLWIVPMSGTARPLTRDPAWFDLKPFFDRTGARVIFSRRPVDGGPMDVMSVTTEGSDLRGHASLPDANDHSARPSPTRDEIVFVSNREGVPAVYLASLPDGPPRRLSGAEGMALAPRWSPDGEKIVMTTAPEGAASPSLSNPESLETSRVQVIDRTGQVLLDVPGLMPSWMEPWR